jgi:hypothetical protein
VVEKVRSKLGSRENHGPRETITREKMNNVTNTFIAPPHSSSQEYKDACFLSKTTQKLYCRESLQ